MLVKMPQSVSRIDISVIDKETKYLYYGDSKFQFSNAVTDNVNRQVSDFFMNCDSLNIIEIKEKTEETKAMVIVNKERGILSFCDTLPIEKNATTINAITTYLCHKCKAEFPSRDLFETHYK